MKSTIQTNHTGVSTGAAFCTLIADGARAQIVQKVVCSKSHDPRVVRTVLTLRRVGGKIVLQEETFREAEVADVSTSRRKPVQAGQVHRPLEELPARLWELIADCDQINLLTTAGNAEFRRSKKGKETVLGLQPIRRALDGAGETAPEKVAVQGNDKVKQRILQGDEAFLRELGVSDANGRIHDKKQSKFRQINRFLELVRDTEPALPAEGPLHIADLCCGKSYLSFAVYHYFTAIRHREVKMVGVDMKAEVMQACSAVAARLGMDGLSFVCEDVGKYEFGAPVHMVLSLHACDTATDLVIDKAIEWGARVILSTPCCHHELNRTMKSPTLDFIAEHSMLKQKFCDAATDALRLKRMEANGYDTAALELIDPEETPKNIMLRGILKYRPTSARCRRAAAAYEEAYRLLTGRSAAENGHPVEGAVGNYTNGLPGVICDIPLTDPDEPDGQ